MENLERDHQQEMAELHNQVWVTVRTVLSNFFTHVQSTPDNSNPLREIEKGSSFREFEVNNRK